MAIPGPFSKEFVLAYYYLTQTEEYFEKQVDNFKEQLRGFNHGDTLLEILKEKEVVEMQIKAVEKTMEQLRNKINEKSASLRKLEEDFKTLNEKYETVAATPPPVALVKDYEDAKAILRSVKETRQLIETLKGKPPVPPRRYARLSVVSSNNVGEGPDEEIHSD